MQRSAYRFVSLYFHLHSFFSKNYITKNDVYCSNFLSTLILFAPILLVYVVFLTLLVILSFFFFFRATLKIVFTFKINCFSLYLPFHSSFFFLTSSFFLPHNCCYNLLCHLFHSLFLHIVLFSFFQLFCLFGSGSLCPSSSLLFTTFQG